MKLKRIIHSYSYFWLVLVLVNSFIVFIALGIYIVLLFKAFGTFGLFISGVIQYLCFVPMLCSFVLVVKCYAFP